MSRTKSIAAAAAFAAFSFPALAADRASALSGDPTQPPLARPAPAFAAFQAAPDEERISLAADPTWIDAGQAAPSLALTYEQNEMSTPSPDEVSPLPTAHYALEMGATQPTVAIAR